jgi:hypothetical protein
MIVPNRSAARVRLAGCWIWTMLQVAAGRPEVGESAGSGDPRRS